MIANISEILSKQEHPMREKEPTLQSIDDYNTLKGEKKKIVWLVILACLVVGAGLMIAKNYDKGESDAIPVEESIGKIPVK